MKGRNGKHVVTGAYLVALLLPLAFNPFTDQPFTASKVRLFWVIVTGMIFVASFPRFQKQEQEFKASIERTGRNRRLAQYISDNPLIPAVLMYCGVYVIATITSIDPKLSLIGTSTLLGTVTILSLVIFFLMVSSAIRTYKTVDRLVTALLVGSVPVAIYGWLQYFGLDPLDWSSGALSPVHSTAGYSLFLGAYLGMVIPFTLCRIVGGEIDGRKRPIPYLLVLVLQVMCLLFTLSRGAWLGLLTSCLLFLWLVAYQWKKIWIIFLSIILLIGGGYLFISMNRSWVIPPPSLSSESSDIPVIRTRTASDIGRTLLWKYTLPMISGRYLLGYGPETYFTAFWQYYPTESYPELGGLRAWDPHNIFLYHLTSTGVSGLVAFLWILYKFYRIAILKFIQGKDRHSMLTTAAILCSASAFLVQAQFNPYSILPLAIFWLVLALGAGMHRMEAEQLAI